MTTATDTDIREIKDLIAAGNAANQKQIADIREEIRVGFANVDTKFAEVKGDIREVKEKIESLNGRLVAVEGNLQGLDARLWGFGGTLLGAVLAALLAIFGRFLFANTPLG